MPQINLGNALASIKRHKEEKTREAEEKAAAEASLMCEEGLKADAEDLSESAKAFKKDMARQVGKPKDINDSEFWVCLCFQTREQCNAFLRGAGWMDLGDKYINGLAVAERMGIKTGERISLKDGRPPDRKWAALCEPIKAKP